MTKTESLYQIMVDHCRKLNFPILDHEKLRLYCWHIYQSAKYDEPILKAIQEGDAFKARELQQKQQVHTNFILEHGDDFLAFPMSVKGWLNRQN
jgi:hypothetical protein